MIADSAHVRLGDGTPFGRGSWWRSADRDPRSRDRPFAKRSEPECLAGRQGARVDPLPSRTKWLRRC